MSSQPLLPLDVVALAERIAAEFVAFSQVAAVALSGSQTTLAADAASDLDLFVYVTEALPVEARATIAEKFADRRELNNQFWEPGDEWIDRTSGRSVDVMYRQVAWIEDQLDRVLIHHQAAVGYSTCFWFNVWKSVPLFDRNGWFEQLQQRANQPYPDALKQAIVTKNYPILRRNLSSYRHQLESALQRRDWNSLNHRTAALLASYFDILFAINAVPHPGEKRLLPLAKQLCAQRPPDLDSAIEQLLLAASPAGQLNLLDCVDRLVDGLDALLIANGCSLAAP